MNGVVKGKNAEDREIVKELLVAKSHQNQAFIYGKKQSAFRLHIFCFSHFGLGVQCLISCHLLVFTGSASHGVRGAIGNGMMGDHR